jgi:hypothetical protein
VAIAHVQDACNSADSTTVAVALSATGTGNALIAPCRCFTPNAPPGPYTSSVTGGGSWTFATADNNAAPPALAFTTSGGASSAFINYILSAASVTSVSTTVTTGNYFEPSVGEFSGVQSAGPGGTSAGTSGVPTTASLAYSNGDLFIATAYPHDGASFSGVPSGFTAFANAGDNVNWSCWQIMSGSGSLAAAWPDSNTDWITAAQVFHAAAVNITGTFGLAMAPAALDFTAAETISGTAHLAMAPMAMDFTGHETGANITGTFGLAMAPMGMRFSGRKPPRAAAPGSDESRGFKRWLLWGA